MVNYAPSASASGSDRAGLQIATEEEARAMANVMRKNTVDFQMAIMQGDGTNKYPPLPMIIIDKAHAERAFPKRTPWLKPGEYGIRYSVRWGVGIPAGHLTFNVTLSNDETGERKQFWLVICPLQMFVLRQQRESFKAITKMIHDTYGKSARDIPIAMLTEQAWKLLEGTTIDQAMMATPERQAFFENNMVMITSCDFRTYTEYFDTLWFLRSRLPITQPLIDYVSHFPCRYCEISKQFLKKQGRILSYDAARAFLDEYPDLKAAFEKIYNDVTQEMEDKVMERSKDMEKIKRT